MLKAFGPGAHSWVVCAIGTRAARVVLVSVLPGGAIRIGNDGNAMVIVVPIACLCGGTNRDMRVGLICAVPI